mgnify:CR=1 FL=1
MTETEKETFEAACKYSFEALFQSSLLASQPSESVVQIRNAFLAGAKWQEEYRYLLEHGKPMR